VGLLDFARKGTGVVTMVSVLRERRDLRRKVLLHPALIEHEGGGGPVRCHVSNESKQSAQITTAVVDAQQIPDNFTLYSGADRVGRQCEVLWRGRHVIGVKFLTETNSLAASE
jgi:hypothetical protein